MSYAPLNSCTFLQTGERHYQQNWKRCYDCFPNEGQGACLNCIAICHAGHNVDAHARFGSFYCDCGSRGSVSCKCISTIPEKTRHLRPGFDPYPISGRDPSSLYPRPRFDQNPPGTYSCNMPPTFPHSLDKYPMSMNTAVLTPK